MGRVHLGEGGLDPVDVQLAVLHVHPEVRVLRAGVLARQEGHVREVHAELEQRRPVGTSVRDRAAQPVIETESVHHEQLRLRHGRHVGRLRLERVDVAALRNEARGDDEGTADLLDHVRENGGRGGHGDGAEGARTLGRRFGARARDDRREEQGRRDGSSNAGRAHRAEAVPAAARQAGQRPNSSIRWRSTV